MSSNAENLARHVRARRLELDLSQLDVWQSGGPSNTTLTEIENARLENLTRTTARKLDAGLRWEPGSARLVWDGGYPVPVAEQGDVVDERKDLRRRILGSSLSDAEKNRLLAALDEIPPPPEQASRGA